MQLEKRAVYFRILRRGILGGFLWVCLVSFVFAEETFYAGFEEGLDGVGLHGERIPAVTVATRTAEGQGKPGKAAIVALEGLASFQELAPEAEIYPVGNLKYELHSVLDTTQGSLSLWACPFFNGSYTDIPSGRQCHYYLFDSGRPDPENPAERLDGIRILLVHTRTPDASIVLISASLALENGETVRLEASVDWQPKTWHHVALSWNDLKATLYFDQAPVATKPLNAALAHFEEYFTVGGTWYGTHPIQGLIDEVRVTNEASEYFKE